MAHRLTQHVTRRRLRSAGERAPARAAAMGAAAAEADRTLFVGNLDPKVTEELIFELFHQVPPPSPRPAPGGRGKAAGAAGRARGGLRRPREDKVPRVNAPRPPRRPARW